MRLALRRREDALLGGLWGAGTLALDNYSTKPAGARSSARRRNADPRAVQDPQKAIAPRRHDPLGSVHRDRHRLGGDQPTPGGLQSESQHHDQHDDDKRSQNDLGHDATIWAKAAKPSDIIPARMKVMPNPRRPCGRSA